MRLDLEAARRVVGRIASDLGKSIEDAASGMLTVASEHMVAAIKEITINEGVDPRDSLLLAGGGAAGLNIVPIARELGCARVLLPRMAGALSACGAQYTDIVTEFGTSQVTQSRHFDFAAVNRALAGLQDSAQEFSAALRERGIERFNIEYFVEARYLNQVWELEVPLPGPRLEGDAVVAGVAAAFHATHEAIFAVSEPEQGIEFIHWKVRITGALDRPKLVPLAASAGVAPASVHTASAYFQPGGAVQMPLYRGESLRPGARVKGPALIIEPTTTIVLYPGSFATVTPFNNYMVDVEP